jgi:cell division transport system ATP-binding protein
MIKAEKVSLIYPDGTVALKDIDLQIEAGDLVYVTGRSGSGKTSLLKLFMGMEHPTEGNLTVLGQPIIKGRTEGIRRLRMKTGPVFQGFRLIDGRTALDNVILGMRFLDIPGKRMKDDACMALERVGLESKIFSLVQNLSWGERQRVAIARSVVRKPALILADEPTGNLDRENALNILELLNSFKDKETSVIITTHATHLISDVNDAVFIRMENGDLKCERTKVCIK